LDVLLEHSVGIDEGAVERDAITATTPPPIGSARLHSQTSLSAKPAQGQIAFRVLFKRLEAQRAADCHHLAFYPHVAKPLAV
jgi:hypothetical protein